MSDDEVTDRDRFIAGTRLRLKAVQDDIAGFEALRQEDDAAFDASPGGQITLERLRGLERQLLKVLANNGTTGASGLN